MFVIAVVACGRHLERPDKFGPFFLSYKLGFRSKVTGSVADDFAPTSTKVSTPTLDVPTPDTLMPGKPENPQKPSSDDKLAKTGDASALPIALAVAAVAAFDGALVAHRKASSLDRLTNPSIRDTPRGQAAGLPLFYYPLH